MWTRRHSSALEPGSAVHFHSHSKHKITIGLLRKESMLFIKKFYPSFSLKFSHFCFASLCFILSFNLDNDFRINTPFRLYKIMHDWSQYSVLFITWGMMTSRGLDSGLRVVKCSLNWDGGSFFNVPFECYHNLDKHEKPNPCTNARYKVLGIIQVFLEMVHT